MSNILSTIRCENADIKQLIRLRIKSECTIDGKLRKPRPLKIVLTKEETKNEIMRKARDLKTTKHMDIFIVQDFTPKERQQRKVLMEERDRQKN